MKEAAEWTKVSVDGSKPGSLEIKRMEQERITDRYMTLEEAAQYLGFSRRNFDRYLKSGEIKFSCPGRAYRFKLEWLDEFMERHSASPKLGRVDAILERLNV